MAEEVIQGTLSSIYTKTITINAPGITRYLGEEECKKIMNEMERKFQVYIIIKQVPWEPLQDQVMLLYTKQNGFAFLLLCF